MERHAMSDSLNGSDALTNSAVTLVVPTDQRRPCVPVRYIIVFLCMMSTAVMFYLRTNLSVSIVAMVNETAIRQSDLSKVPHTGQSTNLTNDGTNASAVRELTVSEQGTFVWTESMQGIILGSYYVAYTAVQIIAGRLSEKFDCAKLLGGGIFLSAIMTIMTPFAAETNVAFIITVRFLMGVFHGTVLSSIYVMFNYWMPKQERATALALITLGANLGTSIGMPLTGYLCDIAFLGGWPMSFYVSAAITLVWFFVWIFYATHSPNDHRFISQYELNYIRTNAEMTATKHSVPVPWKAILTSRGVWASTIVKGCASFGYMVINSKLPSYLESVMHMKLQSNGLINSILYLAICASMLISGPLSEYMKNTGLMSLTTVRKLFQSAAMLGPAVCLALVPVLSYSETTVIVLLVLTMFALGLSCGGDIPIVSDMSGIMTGTVFGITNTCGSLMGIAAPLLVGILLDHGGIQQWNVVFYISAGVFIFGLIVFDLFATAEKQMWGMDPPTPSEIEIKADNQLKQRDHICRLSCVSNGERLKY